MQRAGFALPVADSFDPVGQLSAMRSHLMADLRAMGETNALARRGCAARRGARSLREARGVYARRALPLPDGRIPATFEMVFLTGWAPHDSQPKPLRPGSAAAAAGRCAWRGPKSRCPRTADG